MPVLDVSALGSEPLTFLAEKFDVLSTKQLEPISTLDHDPVRREIDEAIASALGLPNLHLIAEMLSREPVVANKRISLVDAPSATVDQSTARAVGTPPA